jgi:hypothetical protein
LEEGGRLRERGKEQQGRRRRRHLKGVHLFRKKERHADREIVVVSSQQAIKKKKN